MKKVFYFEGATDDNPVIKALSFALKLISEDQELSSIVLLFPSLTLGKTLLTGIFPVKSLESRSFHFDEPSCGIHFETLRTYAPNHPHILIPIGIIESGIERIEDEWEAFYWVITPLDFRSLKEWLIAHSAIDINTSLPIPSALSLDSRVKNAIMWLKATSFPNEGFYHPLDKNRLKSMANALAAQSVPVEYYSVLRYCLEQSITHQGGRTIADYFVKARSHKFKTDGNYPLVFLTEMMNKKH